ncbi:MAG TPA: alpha/beta hydrolase [Mycobacteriales bacterium]|nr:alpha/beta hydrolase [Mycobacteriales bacterium]
MAGRRVIDDSAVLVDGPWVHRDVSANGVRFHVAELGTGPLVLLLHGFPQFWWTWRAQIVALAAAGYRVVAPDLRGYGASDKPPRGYDQAGLSADVVGLIRALGESDAAIVGHDWGGVLAVSTAVLRPAVVRRIAMLGIAHPLAMRSAIVRRPQGQFGASSYLLGFQLPWQPERRLVRNDARWVAELLALWGGPGYPDPEAERRYRDAMQILYVPHRSLEYYRWFVRSQLRPDGHRFSRALREPVPVPTLHIHGALDRCVLASTARASGRYVAAAYEWLLIDGVGHFPHEEAADRVNGELVRWLKDG